MSRLPDVSAMRLPRNREYMLTCCSILSISKFNTCFHSFRVGFLGIVNVFAVAIFRYFAQNVESQRRRVRIPSRRDAKTSLSSNSILLKIMNENRKIRNELMRNIITSRGRMESNFMISSSRQTQCSHHLLGSHGFFRLFAQRQTRRRPPRARIIFTQQCVKA